MRKKQVPHAKMSKKEKLQAAKQRRVSWAFSPVSRVKQSKKTYKRSKAQPQEHLNRDLD